jgi:hypothetical protein
MASIVARLSLLIKRWLLIPILLQKEKIKNAKGVFVAETPLLIVPFTVGRLTLGILRSFTGPLETNFFPFFHPCIAGEQPGPFEDNAEFGVCIEQSSRHTVANCSSLPDNSPPTDFHHDLEIGEIVSQLEGFADLSMQGLAIAEVIFGRFPVDYNLATPWKEAHPGHGAFSPPCALIIVFLSHQWLLNPSRMLQLCTLWSILA